MPRALLSLRVHLLVVVLGAMLPGAILTAILISRMVSDARGTVERQVLDAARLDAAALDREFESHMRTLHALGAAPALDRGDLGTFYDEARRVHVAERDWYAVVLLATDGRQLIDTRVPFGTALLQEADPDPSFDVVRRTLAGAVGPVRVMAHDSSRRGFAVGVPVMRDAQLRYILAAVVDVAGLDRLVLTSTSVETWTRSIIDSAGVIAARTRESARFVGRQVPLNGVKDQLFRDRAIDGTEVYAAVSASQAGWLTGVLIPRRVLDAPIQMSNVALVAGASMLIVCGLLAVVVMSRRLTWDLHDVAAAAEAIAEGDLPKGSRPVHVAETRKLWDSLVKAASLLERRQRERDVEVERADAARMEAERASRTKDHFLAVLGHELRNPLAPAVTALELMKARSAGVLERERQVLERQIGHMIRLVDDLLDIARLSRGQIALRPSRVEARDVIDRAVTMAGPLMERQHHQIVVDAPTSGLALDADQDRVVQIVANLLMNAAKYTPPGGHLCVRARRHDDDIEMTVDDDGPGVAADLRPVLFDPFAQGPRTMDRRDGGLGLGLALAKRLTELHGGTITYEPRLPSGSRFVVRLPVTAAVGQAASPGFRRERSASQGSRRVLVVDDNLDAAEMLQQALTAAGHLVVTAGDGATALARARTWRPDVGVLDIGLPEMSGYELAQKLRVLSPDILLIAVTGYGQPADVETARNVGFDAHFAKPVTMATLVEAIEGRAPAEV